MAPESTVIRGRQHNIDREPDRCPVCHFAIKAQDRNQLALCPEGGERDSIVEMLYQCPRQQCNRFFIARYRSDPRLNRERYGELKLIECVPFAPTSAQIPAEVAAISPDFPKIYNQARTAEAYGLDEIAGGGYRKALEFLVKDYCTHLHPDPDETKEIRKTALGACIAQYVERQEIKTVASRASWLGNDELHYERRWEPDDLVTLKDLIKLTISWVDDSIRTAKYEKKMQPK